MRYLIKYIAGSHFNNKMMRIGPSAPKDEARGGRKFGNIINRSLTPPTPSKSASRVGTENKTGGNYGRAEHRNRHPEHAQNLQVTGPSRQQQNDEGSLGLVPRLANNREFQNKVQNINKIHGQISCLLQCIRPKLSQPAGNPDCNQQHGPLRAPFSMPERSQGISLSCYVAQSPDTNKVRGECAGQQVSQGFRAQEGARCSPSTNPYTRTTKRYYDYLNPDQPVKNASMSPDLASCKIQQSAATSKLARAHTSKLLNHSAHSASIEAVGAKSTNGRGHTYEYRPQGKYSLENGHIKHMAELTSQRSTQDEIEDIRWRIQQSQLSRREMELKYLHGQHLSYQARATEAGWAEHIQKPVSKLRKYLNTQTQSEQRVPTSIQRKGGSDYKFTLHPCAPEPGSNTWAEQACTSAMGTLLAQKIAGQVKLDQQLRQLRVQFTESTKSNKWQALQSRLAQLGLPYDIHHLVGLMAVRPNESDPLAPPPIDNSDLVDQLARSFAACEHHWAANFGRQTSHYSHQASELFDIRNLDLARKGYLSIEDFVSFVNMHTDNYFRNRDLVYLFRRINGWAQDSSQVRFQIFQKHLVR